MLDAYGLPVSNLFHDNRRLDAARDGYEADCARRGLIADWDRLDPDTRCLWFMTADAILEYGMIAVPPAVSSLQ